MTEWPERSEWFECLCGLDYVHTKLRLSKVYDKTHDGDKHHYGKYGRVAVTADMEMGNLDCRCCRRNRSCPHKSVCLWYLRQYGLIDKFYKIELENKVPTSEFQEVYNLDEPQQDMVNDTSNNKIVNPPPLTKIISKECASTFTL